MKPNSGHLPYEAIGKRVRVILERAGKVDDNPTSPPGWAADGRGGCRWTLTGAENDIAEYEVVG